MSGTSGRRDFAQFQAKLEKHIERLPDYAQRAQEKLQRYLPPEQQGTGAATRPRVVSQALPVLAEARSKWVAWNSPEARLVRSKRRTSRALTLWIMGAVLCVLWVVIGFLGLAGGVVDALPGLFGTVVFTTLSVRSGLRLRQLNRTVLPVSTAPPSLPPARSVARAPMRKLAECEATLADLLRQLSEPSALGAAPVPEYSVADARSTAAEAATALRALALRIQTIERARDAAPAGERAALDSALGTLRAQLEDGVENFAALVAAAGRAVAASSHGLADSRLFLTDATDRLAGLALALRELA
ncbi:phage shock envelope stress response protein PspM [Amycolatopsis granulosa]|uniref:phage shock envelope stress response protein PspM n=1 Tax=Amycolatopsis granulosa TaxID=185684 RepID=UPI001423FE5F|nr:hypothetical protein [Amycolatopsis granulosa]NIH84270.1 hypothetical protein [Amycolatopsis granulosa]